jgi:type III restriction enzyme
VTRRLDRAHLEIKWANVLRVETVVKPQLTIAWDKVPALVLDPASTPISADLAPALGGATDMGQVSAIDLERLPDGFRLQRLVFQAARKCFAELRHSFSGTEEYLAVQAPRHSVTVSL